MIQKLLLFFIFTIYFDYGCKFTKNYFKNVNEKRDCRTQGSEIIVEITDSTRNKTFCSNCSLNTLHFTPGSLLGEQPSIPKGIEMVRKCQKIAVVCDTRQLPGAFVFMNVRFQQRVLQIKIYSLLQFNNSGRGPLKNFLPRVKAILKCLNNHWCYIEKNYTTPVNDVECHQGHHGYKKVGTWVSRRRKPEPRVFIARHAGI